MYTSVLSSSAERWMEHLVDEVIGTGNLKRECQVRPAGSMVDAIPVDAVAMHR